ncbi:MAG: PDZ domain-containing protein [Bacteroidetes bacterium]|nr:PDZ domain-containing protein [Bacteroidota bacterium]
MLFFMSLAISFLHLSAQPQEARLLRFPATNEQVIVFTYAGDLFSVPFNGGEAKRLTSHVGYEMFARFAPDGKSFAFTGQYDGNTEVFTMSPQGGEPLRITYTATLGRDDIGDRMGPNNIVMTWTPDGKNIIYRSRKQTDGFVGMLFSVNKEGGLSEPLPLPEGGFCSYAPDGKQLAYNRVFREFRTWKYYKGGMADDIWIYDFKTRQTVNITNHPAQDIMPMWIGDNIFYLSDRDRIMNVFVYNTKTKTTEKVTDFKEYDVKFASHFGKTIVFENGGYIYTLNADTRKAEKVSIQLASENLYARNEVKDASRTIRSTALSPNGERIVFTARGEIFNVPAKSGVTFNMSRSSGAHERAAEWSPDGKYIAYISDVSGETEVYLQPQEGGEPVALTSGTTTYIFGLSWSPDSKYIAYSDKQNNLRLIDVAAKKSSLLVHDPAGAIRGFDWSPDSKYLTYTRNAANNMGIVYVYQIAERREFPVTDKWYNSRGPVFSKDGKYLLFRSAREFNPTYSSIEWNYSYGNMDRLYLCILSKDTPSPFVIENDEVKTGEAKEASKAEVEKMVKIDFEGLADRTFLVPVSAGNFGMLFAEADKIYYSDRSGVKQYDLKTQKEESLTDATLVAVSANGKKAAYRKGTALYVDNFGSKPALNTAVDVSGMKVVTDYALEWAQIFDEAWRYMRDGFYMPNMHGVDWKAMRQKYEVLVPYVKHREDLNYVLGEMVGELCIGHAYINPGELPQVPRIKTGLLGAEISRDASGFFKIEKIIPGVSWNPELRSPLMEKGVEGKKGEYIIAIDGVYTNTVNDLYKLLVGKADVNTQLLLNTKPAKEGARKVVIKPLASESQLYHYNWVQENIRKVEEASGGRIGYIYIPDMGAEGLNEFARYFYPQLDKEGLIIDDRANGGGNVSPMILERLNREVYRVTMSNNSTRISTVPDATLNGPKVCLINKYSASDGDLFPWGFRALGLGPLIGTRTWGGIVGISGSIPFIDGTDMRVPFFTSYSFETGEWIIENHGVDPDILIDNDPAKEWAGEDQQLNRAIEEVMKRLPARKPIPPIPAPRDFSK